MGSHVVAVDAGAVVGHAGGQQLDKGPIVPEVGPQVEGGDGGVAAHRLRDGVGHHAGVPVVEDGLGDAHPANGGTGWPSHSGSGGVVKGLAVGKGAPMCAGGVCESLDLTNGERTVGHGARRGTLHAQEGS